MLELTWQRDSPSLVESDCLRELGKVYCPEATE
jgi:hypothetical protein